MIQIVLPWRLLVQIWNFRRIYTGIKEYDDEIRRDWNHEYGVYVKRIKMKISLHQFINVSDSYANLFLFSRHKEMNLD